MEWDGVIQDERKSSDEDLTALKTKATGRKRRAWLDDEDNTPPKEKGFINQVYRPEKEKGSIDPIKSPPFSLAEIRQNPLQLVRFLHCLIDEKNTYTTRKVKLREIMQQVDISRDSARTALRFLLKNNLISRVNFKPGRSGWSQYQLSQSLCEEIENAILKGSIDPFKEKGSNSSSYINNTITTIRPLIDWESIDTTPLASIGLTQKHLLQIKSKIDPKLVQESIHHFAYAIRYNPKVKKYTNPLATFITVLKRGEAWVEADYRSPQEIAMMQLVSQKKAERQRIEAMEKTLIDEAFIRWKASLTHEQRESYISDEAKKSKIGGFKEASLRAYFVEQVWPKNIPKDLSDLKKQALLFENSLVNT